MARFTRNYSEEVVASYQKLVRQGLDLRSLPFYVDQSFDISADLVSNARLILTLSQFLSASGTTMTIIAAPDFESWLRTGIEHWFDGFRRGAKGGIYAQMRILDTDELRLNVIDNKSRNLGDLPVQSFYIAALIQALGIAKVNQEIAVPVEIYTEIHNAARKLILALMWIRGIIFDQSQEGRSDQWVLDLINEVPTWKDGIQAKDVLSVHDSLTRLIQRVKDLDASLFAFVSHSREIAVGDLYAEIAGILDEITRFVIASSIVTVEDGVAIYLRDQTYADKVGVWNESPLIVQQILGMPSFISYENINHYIDGKQLLRSSVVDYTKYNQTGIHVLNTAFRSVRDRVRFGGELYPTSLVEWFLRRNIWLYTRMYAFALFGQDLTSSLTAIGPTSDLNVTIKRFRDRLNTATPYADDDLSQMQYASYKAGFNHVQFTNLATPTSVEHLPFFVSTTQYRAYGRFWEREKIVTELGSGLLDGSGSIVIVDDLNQVADAPYASVEAIVRNNHITRRAEDHPIIVDQISIDPENDVDGVFPSTYIMVRVKSLPDYAGGDRALVQVIGGSVRCRM